MSETTLNNMSSAQDDREVDHEALKASHAALAGLITEVLSAMAEMDRGITPSGRRGEVWLADARVALARARELVASLT